MNDSERSANITIGPVAPLRNEPPLIARYRIFNIPNVEIVGDGIEKGANIKVLIE